MSPRRYAKARRKKVVSRLLRSEPESECSLRTMQRLILSTKGEDLSLLEVAWQRHDAEGKSPMAHRPLLALAAKGCGPRAAFQRRRSLQAHSVNMLATSLASWGRRHTADGRC